MRFADDRRSATNLSDEERLVQGDGYDCPLRADLAFPSKWPLLAESSQPQSTRLARVTRKSHCFRQQRVKVQVAGSTPAALHVGGLPTRFSCASGWRWSLDHRDHLEKENPAKSAGYPFDGGGGGTAGLTLPSQAGLCHHLDRHADRGRGVLSDPRGLPPNEEGRKHRILVPAPLSPAQPAYESLQGRHEVGPLPTPRRYLVPPSTARQASPM